MDGVFYVDGDQFDEQKELEIQKKNPLQLCTCRSRKTGPTADAKKSRDSGEIRGFLSFLG